MEGIAPRKQAFPVWPAVAILLPLTLLSVGCSILTNSKRILHTSGQGTVALEEIVDWSFEASHPASIDSESLSRALQGVRVGGPEGTPAYSEQDIAFMAPLLSHALSKARSEHMVAFHLAGGEGSRDGIIGGTLYVKGPSLYLTPLRSHRTKSSTLLGSSPTEMSTGSAQALSFEPHSVARSQKANPDAALGHPHLTSFVIDRLALSKLPLAAPVQTAAPAPVSLPAVPQQAVSTPVADPAVLPPTPPVAVTPPQAPTPAAAATSEAKPTRKGSSGKAGSAAKAVKQPAKRQQPATSEHRAILDMLKKSPAPESPK